MYELRSYHLKPGTMVEWGNYWAKAIKLRDYQHTEAYMGLFSQIGELYNVKVLVFLLLHTVHREASRKLNFSGLIIGGGGQVQWKKRVILKIHNFLF